MTNGEKMLNVFCDSKALELGGNVSFRDGDWAIMFPDEWWHTEYKEPTTKNDLEVQKAIEIIKADSLAPYSVDDILKARDLAVEALKQMKTAKNSLSAEEVTALAEWTTKLTKASEDAYNKGYADGMKAQEPRKGHWIYDYTSADGHRTYHCSKCGCYIKPKHSEPLNSFNWCSLCGADMREVKE